MLKSEGTQPIQADGTAQWPGLSAFGYQLIPRVGNRGGFPVQVELNGDIQHPVTLRGPDIEHGPVRITQVRIIKASDGDKWDLYTLPSESDRRGQELLGDSDGYLVTRRAPSVVLFSQECSGAVTGPHPGAMGGFIYINPLPLGATGDKYANDLANPGTSLPGVAFATGAGSPWNVSRFRMLELIVESTAQYPATNLMPFVEVVSQQGVDNGAYQAVASERWYSFGGNFGSAGTTRRALVQLGSASEAGSSTAQRGAHTLTGRWSPYVRFGVEVVGGTFPLATVGGPGEWGAEKRMRLTARAW